MSGCLYRTGRVAACNANEVRVTFSTASACASCNAGLGCGIGPIVGLFQSPPSCRVGADQPGAKDLSPGDVVRVSIGARRLLEHLCLVYVMPLVGLLAGATAGTWLTGVDGDLYGVAGAGLGLVLAHLLARATRAWCGLDVGLTPRIVPPDE